MKKLTHKKITTTKILTVADLLAFLQKLPRKTNVQIDDGEEFHSVGLRHNPKLDLLSIEANAESVFILNRLIDVANSEPKDLVKTAIDEVKSYLNKHDTRKIAAAIKEYRKELAELKQKELKDKASLTHFNSH